MRKAVLLAVTFTVGVGVASAGAASAATPTVKVKLTEFKVLPSTKTVKAGKVSFSIKNAGTITHEFVVVKTNRAPGSLAGPGGKANERGRVGKVADLVKGESGKLTLSLKAGKYVLLCNIPGHYPAGQYIGFKVK